MHTSPMRERVHEFEDQCRLQGLPITTQRRAIFEVVVESPSHPTADQVFEAVRRRIEGISRTTVYRVLDVLVGLGLVQRVPHPLGASRFDGVVQRHDHLICRGCGRVHDVFDPRLDTLPLPTGRAAGFRVESHSVVFTGLCSPCRARS